MRTVCGRCVKNLALYHTLTWSCYIRSAICDYNHIPEAKLDYEHICGRPLGLRFDKRTGELYIADAYLGILKVGPQGGLAEPVVTGFNGESFKLCNDLDFDEDGNLYFTVSSTKYQRRYIYLPHCVMNYRLISL